MKTYQERIQEVERTKEVIIELGLKHRPGFLMDHSIDIAEWVNGCGPEKIFIFKNWFAMALNRLLLWAIPQRFLGNVWAFCACIIHDDGYAHGVPKEMCDSWLEYNLAALVRAQASWYLRGIDYVATAAYYGMVSGFGQGAYDEAKKKEIKK
jgi:hypothetical protein